MGTCVGNICKGNIQYAWEVYRAKGTPVPGKKIEWELDEETMEKVQQYTKELVFVVKKFILTPGIQRFVSIGVHLLGPPNPATIALTPPTP